MQKNSIVSYGSHQSDLNNFMTLIKRNKQKMRQPNYNYLYVWLLDCSVIIDVSMSLVLLLCFLQPCWGRVLRNLHVSTMACTCFLLFMSN